MIDSKNINPTIQKLIDTKAKMLFNDGASEASIANYENEAKISLPVEFKEWLSFSNGGEIFAPGTVIYGINTDAKCSLLSENEVQKRKAFSLDDSLLIVGQFNFGDLLCIDLNSGEVVQWSHETDEEFLRWNGFFAFLEEEITSFASEN